MVDFAGWSMPVQYSSIVEEHQACRTSAALFDVSHMGRIFFEGEGTAPFLDSLLTRRVADMEVGKVRYSLLCNEAGGILDDVLVYHLLGTSGPAYFMMVVNAGNRLKIVEWLQSRLPSGVKLSDETAETAMIAVQGPQALEFMAAHVGIALPEMGYYTATVSNIDGTPGIISRTGYTGEDGCELILHYKAALPLWQALVKEGAKAAGLGARDTLRLEAAMPLYGHELNETINPFQAGLNFAVNLKGREFVGRPALEQFKHDASQPQRIGLSLPGRRVPREHYGVFAGEEAVGEITSGTFSPTLQHPIAMAYVKPNFAAMGTQLTIDIRGSREAAEVVSLPFYKRSPN